jgi:hydrogenase-4 component J
LMSERAVFYQLTHKFVNDDKAIPEEARQVIYYSLAIGHHVGVMDCFQSLMEIPLDDYRQWIARLPEGVGRHKLEGVLKWGEIEINSSHTGVLVPAINAGLPQMSEAETHWAGVLVQCLQKMVEEPALYLMVRKMA